MGRQRTTKPTPQTQPAAPVPIEPLPAIQSLPRTVASIPLPAALALAAIWLFHLAVQINKPLHIDDTHYLAAAKWIAQHPLLPLCNTINWKRAPDLAYRDNLNPPFYQYLQALVLLCCGESIPALHVLASLMILLAAVSTYFIARRFSLHPLAATALCMLSPTLLPVTNLMVDVPAMALGLAGLCMFLRAVDQQRPRPGLAAGLLVGASLLTKYNSIVLLPVLGLYAWQNRRPLYALFMLIPVGLLGIWIAHNYFFFPNHEIHVLLTARYHEFEHSILGNFCGAGMVFGSSFICLGVFFLFRLRMSSTWRLVPVIILAILLFQLPGYLQPGGLGHIRPEYVAFTINTLLLLALALGRFAPDSSPSPAPAANKPNSSPRRPSPGLPASSRDEWFLWSWIIAVESFQIIFAFHQAPRYHLLAFPPFAILLIRAMQRAAPRWGIMARNTIFASLVAQAALALPLAIADHAQAAAGRDIAEYLRSTVATPERKIYLIGHWGTQYYCDRAGIPCFDAFHQDIHRGDLFLFQSLGAHENFVPIFYRARSGAIWGQFNTDLFTFPVAPKDFPNPTFFSVIDPGYTLLYATFAGQVPYSWLPRVPYIEKFFVLESKYDILLSQRGPKPPPR